jgi:AraC-like DNA-binding protein
MPTFLNDPATAPEDAIRFGAGAPGIERAEVRLASRSFAPHRHDTYAIGVTTAGVQEFRYRGERRICRAGQWHVLHPDEPHDGGPATDRGFGYRIMYLAPELIGRAVGGALPFVEEPVHPFSAMIGPVAEFLRDIDEPIDDLRRIEIIVAAGRALEALGGRPRERAGSIDVRSVEAVRDYLDAHATEQTSAATLERIAGADRFTIARHFRRAFGTSPDRYRTMRRLDIARAALDQGLPPARVAADTGFADQSHLTRQFRRAYGMTPARWAALTAASRGPG